MRRIERISTRTAGCAAAICCSVLATGASAQSCSGDLNRDGTVNGADLGLMMGAFNGTEAAFDLNHDGIVNGADLGLLLSNWTGS